MDEMDVLDKLDEMDMPFVHFVQLVQNVHFKRDLVFLQNRPVLLCLLNTSR